MDFSNLTERFTKKLGPLPIWAWALIIVGVGYAAYRLTAGGAGGSAATAEATPDEGYSVDSPSGAEDTFSPDTSASLPASLSGGGGYAPIQSQPQTLYSDSSGIGLGSYGEGNPLPVIIDSINPNLFTPSTAMEGGSSASDGVPLPNYTPSPAGSPQVQAVASSATNAVAAAAATVNAQVAAAKTAAVQQVNEARAAEARAAALAAEARTKKERAAAAAAAVAAAAQRAEAQAAIAKSQKLQGK